MFGDLYKCINQIQFPKDSCFHPLIHIFHLKNKKLQLKSSQLMIELQNKQNESNRHRTNFLDKSSFFIKNKISVVLRTHFICTLLSWLSKTVLK